MQRIGVLGGTFDPIHAGHIALAKAAMAQGGLDRVLILPMARPAHREAEAGAEERLQMCRMALKDEQGLALSEAGMAPGVRFTFDTLGALRKAYPGAALVIILGADKLSSLPYWHEADKLFAQCSFLCFPRAGVDTEAALAKVREAGADVTLLQAGLSPWCSSMIRERTAAWEDAPGLNRRVLCYMAERGLYQPDFLPRLQTMMNPRRFRHTLGVRQEAVRLADLHGAPIQKAALAGILHDCAKGMRQQDMEKIAREKHLETDEQMLSSGAMLHGPVGAYLAKEQFGIRDEEVLNAIRRHTIGAPGMGLLDLVIFVADATEPNREDYEGLGAIRKLAEVSLAAAALKSMQLTQDFLERTHRPFYPVVFETMRDLESRLSGQEKALLASTK